MIITATNLFTGTLDLSAGERLQEDNPLEKQPFRLYIKPGETVTVPDQYYVLRKIQSALQLGYIHVTLQYTRIHVGVTPPAYPGLYDLWVDIS